MKRLAEELMQRRTWLEKPRIRDHMGNPIKDVFLYKDDIGIFLICILYLGKLYLWYYMESVLVYPYGLLLFLRLESLTQKWGFSPFIQMHLTWGPST
jgi:hypothetical protein